MIQKAHSDGPPGPVMRETRSQPRAERKITMKYEVKFSCGHTETVELFGKNADRQRKIAWFEESGLCSKCYAEQKSAEMAEGFDAVEMFYGEYKEKYSDCKTKPGSYNRETKTIIVYVPKEEPTEEREAEIIKNHAREHMNQIKFQREELGLSDGIVRKVEYNLFRTIDKLKAKDIIRNKAVFTYENILSVAKQSANK